MKDFCQGKIKEIELPSPIHQYCFKETDEFLHWSLERYEDLIKAREIFQVILRFNLQNKNKSVPTKTYLASLRLNLWSIVKPLRKATSDLGFDENGNFAVTHSEILDILTP